MDIWKKIEAFDKNSDFGTVVKVDPRNDTVERYTGSKNPLPIDGLYLGDEDANQKRPVDWPKGLDYQQEFHPSEFFEAPNWKYHLEPYYNDGTPFLYELLAIDDPDDMEALVGWALVVKVL